MRLTHETDAARKEQDGKGEKGKGFSKSPLSEKIMGKAAAVLLAAAVPALTVLSSTSSCTFDPNGIAVEHDGNVDTDGNTGTDADVDMDADTDTDGDADTGYDGGPDLDADVDTDADTGTDADVDGGPDADVDADVDGGELDGGPDADVDVDAGEDAGLDAGEDAGVDAGEDAGPDADAGPVVCATASTGTFNDVMNLAVPTSIGGYTFEYLGISSGEALIDITCGGNGVETGGAYPEDFMTTVNVPIDGKKIQITPHTLNAGWVDITIVVSNL